MITPELKDWILHNTEAGFSPDVLLTNLLKAGWTEDVALEAFKIVFNERIKEISPPTSLSETKSEMPEPDLTGSPTSVTINDRTFHVLFSMKSPRLVVFRNFLSDEECDELIAAAQPRLKPSTVVDNDSGKNAIHDGRVSEGMFFDRFETPLVQSIEERIAELVRWPVDRGETLQILRYETGGKYDPHFDYFNPNFPGSRAATERGGNRVGTLIMVLKTPTKGGSTVFPDANLEVFAQRGNAIFFSYKDPDPATKTLHGGAPVIEGEKWIATKWLRERAFVTKEKE